MNKLLNTTNFDDLNPNEYKKNTAAHWGKDPCESRFGEGAEELSKEYFEEIANTRYGTHGWILDDIHGFDISGKKVLEVGYGMGTDHLEMARMGAEMYGVSITPHDKEVVDKRFELYGLRTNTYVADAENLPFEDNTFDFVYSFGVVHHTPNTEKAISEIYRVLKPGGSCYITVYNKNSMFFWWTVLLWDQILRGGFRKHSLKQRLSMVEYPNDDTGLVIRLYTKRQFSNMMKKLGFHILDKRVDQLIRLDIAHDNWFSDRFIKKNSHRMGWYVIVEARK